MMNNLTLAISYRTSRFADNFCSFIARHMPKKIRYWATIESCVEATTGQYSDTIAPDLSIGELLQRIEK